MDHFIDFVQNWGYIAVFLGSMIEGESVILTAGILAYEGYLSLPKIMIIAFIGTFFADQALFQLGHFYGESILDRFPKLKPKTERVFDFLRKWDVWYILIFRFIYGIRIISPVVIGTAGISPWRFIPLNFLSAVIWTIVSCIAGYLLGSVFEQVVENFHIIQRYFVAIPIIILVIAVGIYMIIRKRKHKKTLSSDSHKQPLQNSEEKI